MKINARLEFLELYCQIYSVVDVFGKKNMLTHDGRRKGREKGNGWWGEQIKGLLTSWCNMVVLTPPRLGAETGTWSLCNPGPSRDSQRKHRQRDWALYRQLKQRGNSSEISDEPPVPAGTSRWARGASWCQSRLASPWADVRCWPALYPWSSPAAIGKRRFSVLPSKSIYFFHYIHKCLKCQGSVYVFVGVCALMSVL